MLPEGVPARELYTIPEVAELLALSERTVKTLISQGHLRSAIAPGTGRARRISRLMIDEYLGRFNAALRRRTSLEN